jgi:cytochrome c
MKKFPFILSVLVLVCFVVSCKKETHESFGKAEASTEVQKPEALGKIIFEGKGTCVACHKIDVKLVGPSLQDIAKSYKDKKGNMVTFLKGDAEPIVDPSQYEVMKPNLALTKTFTDEELKALEAYVYSHSK